MKNIKVNLIFSIFCLTTAFISTLYGMEQSHQDSVQALQREASLTNFLYLESAQNHTIDTINLKDSVKNIHFPTLLDYKNTNKEELLIKLSLLANGLIMIETITDHLKSLISYSTMLKDTAVPMPISSFIFHRNPTAQGKFKILRDGGTIEELEVLPEDCLEIKTPEGKSLALQLVTLYFDVSQAESTLNKYQLLLNRLINSKHEELSSIAKNYKHSLVVSAIKNLLSLFNQNIFFHILTNISTKKTNPYQWVSTAQNIEEINKAFSIIENNTMQETFDGWLDVFHIKEAVYQIMPHWPMLYTLEAKLARLFDLHNDNTTTNFVIHKANALHKLLTQVSHNITEVQECYQGLYKNILAEQNRIIRSLPTSLKRKLTAMAKLIYLDNRNALKALPLSIFEEKHNVSGNNTDINDYYIPSVTKKCMQKSTKKQKRSRHRPHRKEEAPEKEIDKIIKNKSIQGRIALPKYAARILRWFDQEYIQEKQPNFRSITYHTFNPLTDFFIKKYGRVQKRQNQTYPTKMDTVYYLGGEITYADTTKETVLFVNSYDEENVCYHRGFENHENKLLTEFTENKFFFDFPQLNEEVSYTKKHLIIENDFNNLYQQTTFEENDFCLHLNDRRNNIKITLFKPLQKS